MRSDTEIKMQAFQVLFQSLGSLETERFISIIKRNNFDYTKWRENLPKFNSVQELSKAAMESRKKK
jgi:hypothetical protein